MCVRVRARERGEGREGGEREREREIDEGHSTWVKWSDILVNLGNQRPQRIC